MPPSKEKLWEYRISRDVVSSLYRLPEDVLQAFWKIIHELRINPIHESAKLVENLEDKGVLQLYIYEYKLVYKVILEPRKHFVVIDFFLPSGDENQN